MGCLRQSFSAALRFCPSCLKLYVDSFAPLRSGCPPWATHLSFPLDMRYRAGVLRCAPVASFAPAHVALRAAFGRLPSQRPLACVRSRSSRPAGCLRQSISTFPKGLDSVNPKNPANPVRPVKPSLSACLKSTKENKSGLNSGNSQKKYRRSPLSPKSELQRIFFHQPPLVKVGNFSLARA
jgi:hypothetical protein